MAETLTLTEIEEIGAENAAKYPDYLAALLKDQTKVIKTQLNNRNNRLPEGPKVKIVQETGETILLRLAHMITGSSELSDSDLKQVAGGKDDSDSGNTTCTRNNATGGFNTPATSSAV